MFHTNGRALDIFGDKKKSEDRRRCQPTSDDNKELYELHLRVAISYVAAYAGIVAMPYCLDQLDPVMTSLGLPLSLVLEGDDADVSTPWGLAKVRR